MKRLLKLLIWLTLIAATLRWGNIYILATLTFAGVIWETFKRAKEETAPPDYKIPDELFNVPLLEPPGLIMNDLELKKKHDRFGLYHAIIDIVGFLAAIFMIYVAFKSGLGIFYAGLFAAVTIFLSIQLARFLDWFLGYNFKALYQASRKEFLAAHPRPVLELHSEHSRNHFSRHYGTANQAKIAMCIAKAMDVDFMIYPCDNFYVACGGNHAQVSSILNAWFKVSVCATDTIQRLVDDVERYTQKNHFPGLVEINDIPELPEKPAEPPALSPVLANLYQDEKWWKQGEDIYHQEIGQRPPMSTALFCSYWPTREAAAIAMTIRNEACTNFFRPTSMMCYPNDPFPLLTYIADDSMESVEFLLCLEENFKIEIPDSDAEKLMTWSFGEVVEYIRKKQMEKNAAGVSGGN